MSCYWQYPTAYTCAIFINFLIFHQFLNYSLWPVSFSLPLLRYLISVYHALSFYCRPDRLSPSRFISSDRNSLSLFANAVRSSTSNRSLASVLDAPSVDYYRSHSYRLFSYLSSRLSSLLFVKILPSSYYYFFVYLSSQFVSLMFVNVIAITFLNTYY